MDLLVLLVNLICGSMTLDGLLDCTWKRDLQMMFNMPGLRSSLSPGTLDIQQMWNWQVSCAASLTVRMTVMYGMVDVQSSLLLHLYTLKFITLFYSLQHFLYPPSRLILRASLCWIITHVFIANETETQRERFSSLPDITG